MRSVGSRSVLFAAGLAAAGSLSPSVAATGGGEAEQIAEAGAGRHLASAADLTLRFVQEDGPESGHVRVELTPDTRPLTMIEARMAAEQAFLAALKEPGLGDDLSRITVVVRLMPAAHPDPETTEQVIVYRHTGGQDWSVQGE